MYKNTHKFMQRGADYIKPEPSNVEENLSPEDRISMLRQQVARLEPQIVSLPKKSEERRRLVAVKNQLSYEISNLRNQCTKSIPLLRTCFYYAAKESLPENMFNELMKIAEQKYQEKDAHHKETLARHTERSHQILEKEVNRNV